MSCNFRHELRVLHSLPLVADRRVCLQTVLGGSERFRLFFDDEDGSFFVLLSYFVNLIRDGHMSPGSGISGSRLAGNVWVIRKQDVRHRDRDRRECDGHPAIVIAFGRALVAEVQAKLQYLRGEMDRLFGKAAGEFSGTEFPPLATDMKLIQDGLNARRLLALAPGDMGFDPAALETERDELVKACAPTRGSRDYFLMYGEDETALVDDGEDAEDEESDKATDPDSTEASGEADPEGCETSGDTKGCPEFLARIPNPAAIEEDEKTRKKREMAAMWASEARERDEELDRTFLERQAETGQGGSERRGRPLSTSVPCRR